MRCKIYSALFTDNSKKSILLYHSKIPYTTRSYEEPARVGRDTAQCERLILVPDIVSCDLIAEYL
jgi:hypothetical protein